MGRQRSELTDRSNRIDCLAEAIREAENLGFHHCPIGTVEGDHYTALIEAVDKEGMNDYQSTYLSAKETALMEDHRALASPS